MRMLGAGLGGAFTVTLLWYLLNEWVGGVGIAFVRRQGWPVSTAWLAAIVGTVGGVWRFVRTRRVQDQQTAAAAETAAELGLVYTPTVERPTAALPCFAEWHRGTDGTVGEVGGVPVHVFDMTRRIRTGEGDEDRSRTVVLLPAAGLPALTVAPRWFGGRFANAFGATGVTFDPAGAPEADRETVRAFGRAFRIDSLNNTGKQPTPLDEPTAEDRASEGVIRRLFTAGLMAALLRRPGWTFQTDGEWLVCWPGERIRPAGERRELMSAAVETRSALLAAAAHPPAAGLPPAPAMTPGQYVARGGGTFAGWAVGFFGGFFGSVRTVADQIEAVPWLVVPALLCLMAIVIVCMAAGMFVGYWVGAAVGLLPAVARWTPPAKAKLEK